MSEERKYYESEAKRKWQKENTTIISIKLQNNRDQDLLMYFKEEKEKAAANKEEFSVAGAFKDALREKLRKEG